MKPNVEKIVAVWEKEPGLCEGDLVQTDDHGGRKMGCAIGSLLWATGKYSHPNELGICSISSGLLPGTPEANEARALLKTEYGLDGSDLSQVMFWNDHWRAPPLSFETPPARRDYMIAKVREEWGSA